MKTISKSSVMSRAWSLVKSADLSISNALRRAWKELKLQAVKEALQIGFVWITFRKVDGTITTRKATRNTQLVPDPDKPKGSSAASAAVIAFYSETDHAWRSFKTENLIGFKLDQIRSIA